MATALKADISPAALEIFSKRMPARIEQALDFPTVGEMCKAAGEDSVKAYIEFELIKLSDLVSVGGNLNNSQVVFIAQELIKIYPNESLADFKLCFQRGAIGQYGQIFRLDGIVLREWMVKYLEEKYQIVENKLMSERDNLYEPIQPLTEDEEAKNQRIKDRLQEWKSTIEQSANEHKVLPLTDEEIGKEGREKPAKRELYKYKNPEILAMQEARQKLLRAASEFYKDRRTLNLKRFEVEGVDFGAENESDAEQIYKLATEL